MDDSMTHEPAHIAEDIESKDGKPGVEFPATKQEIIDYIEQHGDPRCKEMDKGIVEGLESDKFESAIQFSAEVGAAS